MAAERAEVTVIRGDRALTPQGRDAIEALLAEVNRVFGVGRNEPRKEGAARVAQELADAPMTRRPRA